MSARYFGRKRKKKKLIAAKSGLVGVKGYLEIYNRVKYVCRIFLMRPISRQTFVAVFGPYNSNVTTLKI